MLLPDSQIQDDDYHIYKLNGGIPYERIGELLLDGVLDTITPILNYYNSDIPLLRFGFEERKEKYDEFLKKLKEENSDIEELVIIGYSFPDDNRVTDRNIICSMSNLTNIYIQSRSNNKKIEDILKKWSSKFGKKWEITTIPEIDPFYIPDSILT